MTTTQRKLAAAHGGMSNSSYVVYDYHEASRSGGRGWLAVVNGLGCGYYATRGDALARVRQG